MAVELEVTAATLYNWRRQYRGMDTDARSSGCSPRPSWRRTRCGR
ncbi:hypothetical protein [Rhodococcus opacus]